MRYHGGLRHLPPTGVQSSLCNLPTGTCSVAPRCGDLSVPAPTLVRTQGTRLLCALLEPGQHIFNSAARR
jgi:hypothetical protein